MKLLFIKILEGFINLSKYNLCRVKNFLPNGRKNKES